MDKILNVSFNELQIKEIIKTDKNECNYFDMDRNFNVFEKIPDARKELKLISCIIVYRFEKNNKIIELKSSEIRIDEYNLKIKLYLNNGIKINHNNDFSSYFFILNFL